MLKKPTLFFPILLFLAAAGASGISKPGCPTRCGNLAVPYPFGVGLDPSCSINPFFAIDCDASFDPPKAFLTSEKLEVISISEAELRVKNRLSMECYDEHGTPNQDIEFLLDVSGSPFRFSNRNKLTVVGCGDAAFLSKDEGRGESWPDLLSSCVAICSKPEDLIDGFCSGIGCCQSAIPEGLQSVYVYMETVRTNNKTSNFSSCGYSFLAETSSYSFNVSDVSDLSFVSRVVEAVPMVIDWAIDNRTCRQIGEGADAICQPNSVCVDSGSSLGGYRCRCLQGYEGNPYLSPG